MNAVYGGIHPLHASRLHHRNVPRAVGMALQEAGLGMGDTDAVAYTRGPGMRGCLNACAIAAKTLAAVHRKPLFGVHHMQAHALTPLLTERKPPAFPFLVALVSGGHTQLVLAKDLYSFKIIADCKDAKIGDAFDKVARLLQLPSSPTQGSGAVLEQYASRPLLPPFDTSPLPGFTIPLSSGPGVHALSFSFSGLISSVERYLRHDLPTATPIGDRITGEGELVVTEGTKRAVARAFQDTAVRHLCQKTKLALELPDLKQVKGVVVSGGVASNQYLRAALQITLDELDRGVKLYYPPVALCTDNAAMIAWTAILRMQNGEEGERDDLPIRPKWSIEDLGVDENGEGTSEEEV